MKIVAYIAIPVAIVLGAIYWYTSPKSCVVISFKITPDLSQTYSTKMSLGTMQSGPNMIAHGVESLHYKICDSIITIYADKIEYIVPVMNLNRIER